ncbi:MAG: A/G-specific adenine glycosylase [Terracidiphilus sp.]
MVDPVLDSEALARLRRMLLDWYDTHQRDLPWRHLRNPYAIWVSEIMLQQTRVAVVVDRFQAFLERFPSLPALAKAPEQDVLALWSGLGYYRRARMLHRAAQFVMEHRNGVLPETAEELRLLPGIGAYTAAAIASIAYGQPIGVVDGNVERVLCRLQDWPGAGPAAGSRFRRSIDVLANQLVHPTRPGDFNQALMELGATLCTPRSPQCSACPIAVDCSTRGEHKTAPRPPMLSTEIGCALAVRSTARTNPTYLEVLLEQRPPSESVMPGMWQLPLLHNADVPAADLRMTLRHAIMQVNYYVRVRTILEDDVEKLTRRDGERRWVPQVEAASMALTGLARKVLTRAHLLAPPVAAPSAASVS